MKCLLSGLLMSAIVSVVFSRSQYNYESDIDQQVLDHLKKAGSDLSKDHAIEFFLYFPTEGLATQASKELEIEGCDVKVMQGNDGPDWLCFATRSMVPVHHELVRLRLRFSDISIKYNGKYDGWGTGVVK